MAQLEAATGFPKTELDHFSHKVDLLTFFKDFMTEKSKLG